MFFIFYVYKMGDGEKKTNRPGISDMDKEVTTWVADGQFLDMSDEERKHLIAALNEKDPELAKQEAEYVERAKYLMPVFVKKFKEASDERFKELDKEDEETN